MEKWTDARLPTGKSEIIKDPVCQAKEFKFYREGILESQKDVKLESDKKYVPLRMNTLATIQGNNQEGKDYVCA